MEENGEASLEEKWSQNSRLQKYIRPHSAKTKNTRTSSEANSPTQTRRPVTAHPRFRSETGSKKITRHLKKSHLRPPGRSTSTSPSLPETAVITAVSLDNESYQHNTDSSEKVSVTEPFPGKTRTKSRKKVHPSLQAWLSEPLQNDDAYDTDLEADVQKFAKSIIKADKLKVQRKLPSGIQGERIKPPDPTGRVKYEDECRKHDIIPVTYLLRHLGERNMRMRHHYLSGPVTKALSSAFKENTITESLDLGDNYLQAEGAIYLSKMLMENMFITCLNISNNFIHSEGAAAIAEMLEINTTLKSLCLAGNQLTDQDAKLFIPALKNNLSLTSLDLSNNEFGEQGGIYIAGALSVNESLVDVDLSWNSIRGKGAVAIAKSLINNMNLEVLDLSWNGFGEAGAKALEQSLRVNAKLRVLDLMNNHLNSKAAEKLAAGVRRNFGLETLNLNMNPMGEEGTEAMLKAVSVHPCVKFLSMECCWETKISAKNFQLIQELSDKGMAVLHGGVGGYQRHSSLVSLMQLLQRFVTENRTELQIAVHVQDKDQCGMLYSEDLKTALKNSGFRVTNRQMEMLLEEIDCSHIGNIKYKQILSGEIFAKYKFQKPLRMVAIATREDKSSL